MISGIDLEKKTEGGTLTMDTLYEAMESFGGLPKGSMGRKQRLATITSEDPIETILKENDNSNQ